MNDPISLLAALVALADPDGGWGYGPGQPAHLEPTCLALLGLASEPEAHRSALDAGLAALKRGECPDGFYRLAQGRREAVWGTALALFTQTTLGVNPTGCQRAVEALLSLKGIQPENTGDEAFHDIDLQLVGWPWAEGTFSWVEPTAWACIALTRSGHGQHPRVIEGRKLLLDRCLPEGGVNYGNRLVLNRPLEPLPTPTALALIALRDAKSEPLIDKSIKYLGDRALAGDDLEHLCWARLALQAHDVHTDLHHRISAALLARAGTSYLRNSTMRLALAALALRPNESSPFSSPPATASGVAVAPSRTVGQRSLTERISGAIDGLKSLTLQALRAQPGPSQVHIADIADYNADLADVVCRQFEHFRARVPLAGRRVVIKPNLVEYHRDKVINTHPHVVAAAIELCRREGAAEVIVAEGPGHCRNVEYLVAASGLGDVLREYKVSFVDLNHDEPVRRLNLGRLTKLPHIYLAQTIAQADVVISLPKLKTHHWAGATLSLKNLFGTLPGICYGWPKNVLHWEGIDNSIVDIALTRTPDLAIVDGILGMEGDGPLNGTPVSSGVIVMGDDLLAVDATCCRLMHLIPEKIGYLALGAHKRLGQLQESRIEQLGETVRDRAQPYATMPHLSHLCHPRNKTSADRLVAAI